MYDANPRIKPMALGTSQSDLIYSDTTRYKQRLYEVAIQRFKQSSETRLCFRAVDGLCDPSAVNTSANCFGYLEPDGTVDPVWYPRRCVFLYIIQRPSIVSVMPAELSMMLQPVMTYQDTAPMPPWRPHTRISNVRLAVGQVLQLSIDASDPNEEDNVDIMITNTADPQFPPYAYVGPRLCCDANFSSCVEPTPVCENVCTTTCDVLGKHNGDENMIGGECTEHCESICTDHDCRYVRRVLTMTALPDHIGTQWIVRFIAKDNAGIRDGAAQGTAEAGSLCCNSTDQMSNPYNVTITVYSDVQVPVFVDPTPADNTRLPNAFVNCPIRAFSLATFFSTSSDSTGHVVPEGCQYGQAMSGGYCALPPCTLCVSTLPEGMFLSAPRPYAWSVRGPRAKIMGPSDGGGGESMIMMMGGMGRQLVHASYNMSAGAGPDSSNSSVVMIRIQAQSGIVPGMKLVIAGIMGSMQQDMSLVKIMPTSQSIARFPLAATGKYSQGTLSIDFVGNVSLGNVSFMFEMERSAVMSVNMSHAYAMLDGRALDPAVHPDMTTSWIPLCEECSRTFYGLDYEQGRGFEQVVRWTPMKGQEGRDYSLCFVTTNYTGYGRKRCFHMMVTFALIM